MTVSTVRLGHALPLPTVEGMLAGLAYQCVSGALWSKLRGASCVRPKRLGPRVVAPQEMGPLGGSTLELPCSQGLRPPQRHHQLVGWNEEDILYSGSL